MKSVQKIVQTIVQKVLYKKLYKRIVQKCTNNYTKIVQKIIQKNIQKLCHQKNSVEKNFAKKLVNLFLKKCRELNSAPFEGYDIFHMSKKFRPQSLQHFTSSQNRTHPDQLQKNCTKNCTKKLYKK